MTARTTTSNAPMPHRLAALLLLACSAAAVVSGRASEPTHAASAASVPAPADAPTASHPTDTAHTPTPVAPPPVTSPAVEHAPTAPGLPAREAQGLSALALSLTDRGDYAAAEIAYRQVLNGKAPLPETKSALLGLARMHRKQGYLTKAAAIYEKYLKEYPADERVPDALLDLGRTLRAMGAPKLAIARFYSVINSTLKLPSDEGFEHYQLLAKTAQFEIAETHFQSGDYVEANKFFSRLRMLDLAPADRARAYFKSAYALYLDENYEGAVNALRGYLDQWPNDENVPEARYLVSISLRTLKRPQEALTSTLELLRAEKDRVATDPKRWRYWQRRTGNQLANDFFQGGDILDALSIYRGLAALSDDPAWRTPVTYQVALCYERLGDVSRACATYRTIVETAGPSPSPELEDIVRMATTRLAHIDWQDSVGQQVSTLFDTATGKTANAPSPAPHDAHGSPAVPPPAL